MPAPLLVSALATVIFLAVTGIIKAPKEAEKKSGQKKKEGAENEANNKPEESKPRRWWPTTPAEGVGAIFSLGFIALLASWLFGGAAKKRGRRRRK
jgi:hypothetical protein